MDTIRLIFILVSLTSVTYCQNGCDPGWEMDNNQQCYKFNTLKYINWKDAQSECSTHDASLVRISSTTQLQWLVTTMKAKYQSSGFWTALNDNDKDPTQKLGTGTWKWGFYTPADMTVIQWNTSPANDGRTTCAGFNIQGQLADVSCRAKQGAICMVAAGSNGLCASGWRLSDDGQCLFFTNTSDTTQQRTWSMAREWCQNAAGGADLASIKSKSQMDIINQQVLTQSQNTKIYWAGLQSTNNNWAWLAGGSPDKSIVQWQTEPNNVAGIENCGVLRMTARFSDRDCSSNANYICQKPVYNYTPMDNLGCGPWLRAGKFCYLFSTGTPLNWQDARNKCLVQNADLIKVDNLDKKTWLAEQLLDSPSLVYWSGLNDRQTEGQYVWADTTPLNTSMIAWNVEPNNFLGREDCAVISYNGGYNDVPCNRYHAAAICEIDNDNQRSCPLGWTSNGGKCYLFSSYKNSSLWMNNDEAKAYCVQNNNAASTTVNLLSVTNKNEKAFILQQLGTMKNNSNGWWTSLADSKTEGFWSFADGTSPNPGDWATEPSTAPGDNCGMLNWGGVLHERNCANTHPYICERYAFGLSKGSILVASYLTNIITAIVSVTIWRSL